MHIERAQPDEGEPRDGGGAGTTGSGDTVRGVENGDSYGDPESFARDYAAAAQFVRDGDSTALRERVREHAVREAASTVALLRASRIRP